MSPDRPALPEFVLVESEDGVSHYDIRREGGPVCDFCGERPVRWMEHCAPFDLPEKPEVIATSAGDWAACDACHALVQDGDRHALAARSVACFPFDEMPAPMDDAAIQAFRQEVGEIHARFWQHRLGTFSVLVV